MAKNLASWNKYVKNVKAKVSKGDTKTINKLVEKNAIDMGRVASTTYALLTSLLKKKIISKKEVTDIIDKELKKM
jgi:hypothetical protein|tara:strand:- start:194 stop:418 length:225 start_codon:yes stop_codon:yes gene_type:complete